MDYNSLSTPMLLEFHAKIAACLNQDDQNPSPDKFYLVRKTPDWKIMADAIEAELTRREQAFTAIPW